MTFKVSLAPLAEREIAEFASYAAGYSDAFALDQFRRLNHILAVVLAEAPQMWSPFFLTGRPYHGYLFRVGRRTQFWIVYTFDEEKREVTVLRFWNASREPESLEI